MGMTGGTGKINADINITPLIDVVLVLLIIFMVITPMLQKGRPVQLPAGADPAKKPDTEKDIIVSIEFNEGNPETPIYYLKDGKQPEPPGQLKQKLSDLVALADGAPDPLYIKADKRLRYGQVKEAMLMCEAAGFRGVSLVAEAKPKEN